jgi:hypothetical protein
MTEFSLSAEHGPMISRNLSDFPVNTSAIIASRSAFIAFILSLSG